MITVFFGNDTPFRFSTSGRPGRRRGEPAPPSQKVRQTAKSIREQGITSLRELSSRHTASKQAFEKDPNLQGAMEQLRGAIKGMITRYNALSQKLKYSPADRIVVTGR